MPPRATRHAAISRPVRNADSDAALVASRSCARSAAGSDGASTVPSDRWRACVTIAAASVQPDPFEARVERGGELRGDHGADRGGGEQRGDAGDRVVDRRGDPGVALVGVREHGGGQRRHGHRQPEREDQQRRQHVGQERRVGREPREPQDAARRDERPEAHERARADAVGQRAEATRQQEHHDRAGHRGQPRLDRLVARDLLQVEDEQEEHDAEARVHRERQQVADREVAPPEQVQVEHRMRRVRLPEHERAEQRDADEPRAADERIAPAPQRLLDERQDRTRQPERAEHRADDVDPRARLRRAVRPRSGSPAPASRGRTGTLIAKIARHDATSTSRPPTSGPMTNAIPLHAVQEPIAAPRSSRGNAATMSASDPGVSSAPNAPCSARPRTSTLDRRRDRADDRHRAEPADPDHEDAPLAEQVAQRPADEDERARA